MFRTQIKNTINCIGSEMKKYKGRLLVYGNRNRSREKYHGKGIREFMKEDRGMGTVEIILIIVVLIGLVIIFKKQLNDLVNTIFGTITDQSNMVLGD